MTVCWIIYVLLNCLFFRWTNLITSFISPFIFYMADIELTEVTFMVSGSLNHVATDHPEYILYYVLYGMGHISQIVSRLYLKYVRLIQDSNEIFTKYFVVIFCMLDFSSIALFFIHHELILKIAHYIIDISYFILHPASMIIFHNSLNQYFINKYPKLKQFVS